MQMTPKSVMIFAAGFGTRMMPLTQDRPKPMVPILGRPMIDLALGHAQAVGAETIVVNTHYKGDILAAHFAGTDIRLIDEQPDILDTGGGLRNALPLLGPGPVWTLNPDAIWRGPNPLQYALEHWQPERMDALLVCIDPKRALGTESTGDFHLAADGALSRGEGLIYGGAQILKTDLLHEIAETVFSLRQVWFKLIESGRCFGARYPGEWCDVGHPAGIPLAETLLQGRANVS